MGEGESAKRPFDKGDRAAIVSGRKGVGVRGSVFWTGENKYGSGMRYGLRGDDGETYWVDEQEIGREEDAPLAPKVEAAKAAAPKSNAAAVSSTFDKGDRVTITAGPNGVGIAGSIFWTGESRYGKGMRFGVKGDDEATYWVDENQVEAAQPSSQPKPQSNRPQSYRPQSTRPSDEPFHASDDSDDLALSDPAAGEDEIPNSAPGPTDADLPPEAFDNEDYEDMPF
jgi:hypothetical protein